MAVMDVHKRWWRGGGWWRTESVRTDLTAAVQAASDGAAAVGDAVRAELTQRIDTFNGDIRDMLRAADSRRQLQDQDVAAALAEKVRACVCPKPRRFGGY
jgi:hypothetical protein